MDLAYFLAAHVATSCQQRFFFHFTDRRNLPSIRQHGLLSMRQLRSRGIVPPAPGGDEMSQATDIAKGTDGYVCLSFTSQHPMAHVIAQSRGLDLVQILVKPDIVHTPGLMMTSAASNQTGVVPMPAADMLDSLDLEALYKWTEWKDPATLARVHAARKYEILVPNSVPLASLIIYG